MTPSSQEMESPEIPGRFKGTFDDIWCVFDKDDHARLQQALKQAKDNNFQVAFSNPCFELWYLLHFQDQAAYLTTHDAVSALRTHILHYKKGRAGLYAVLRENQPKAMKRALKLRQNHISGGAAWGKHENPSTSVDRLVRFLNGLAT